MGLSESALSRAGQEHGAVMELVWIGQLIHGAQETLGAGLNAGRHNEENTYSKVETPVSELTFPGQCMC